MYFDMIESEKFSDIYKTIVSLDVDVDEIPSKEVYKRVEQILLTVDDNKTISSFPINLNKFFPNLKCLHIVNEEISSISRKDLTGLDNLEELWIYDCKLKSIPSDLFANMRKLKIVDFSYNKLESVTSDLLKPIINNGLALVDLRGNTKIDAFYSTREDGGVSLQEMMDLIDSQCTKPPEELRFDKTFQAKSSEKFAQLWKTKLFSDFKILTKNSAVIHAHKAVLMVSSPVLSSMLQKEMQETKEGVMKIEEFDPEAVEQFFCFLYTGSIPSDEHAMELFTMADMYEIPELRSMSERIMLENINQSNALAVFNLAHLHSLINLKQKAFESIQEMFPNRKLNRYLFQNPLGLKSLTEAEQARKKEINEALNEAELKIRDAKNKFNVVWDKWEAEKQN